MLVVLDTNVLVAALLSPFGPPARVLDLVLAGDIQAAYDDRLLAEYGEVLVRHRFGFDPHYVSRLLESLAADGVYAPARPLPVALPDPDDLAFLEVAATVETILITGNRQHFPTSVCEQVAVQTPAEFLKGWTTLT